MSQLLNFFLKLAIFSDGAPTLTPQLKDVEWDRQFQGIPTSQDFERRLLVPPGQSILVATTQRSLSQDATTQYTISQPDPTQNSFRYRWVGGTNPILRTARAPGQDATTQFTVTVTGTIVRYTATGGTIPNFVTGGVVVGDTLLIETSTPTVTAPFNPLNQGEFTVVTVATTYLEVLNVAGAAEGPITLGTRSDTLPPLQVYSVAGVADQDTALVQATNFNFNNRGSFTVVRATALYFDVLNAAPGVPQGPITLGSATGIVFYPTAWHWLYAEATNQTVSLRINADTTSDNVTISPILANPAGLTTDAQNMQPGPFLQHGTVYNLYVANNGLVAADVKFILAQ